MIIWTGWGIIAPFIIAACIFAADFAANYYHGPAYVAANPWVLGAGLGLGGLLCWWLGRQLYGRERRVLVDRDTGEEIVLGHSHTFFFLPLPWLGILAVLGAIPAGLYGIPGSGPVLDYGRNLIPGQAVAAPASAAEGGQDSSAFGGGPAVAPVALTIPTPVRKWKNKEGKEVTGRVTKMDVKARTCTLVNAEGKAFDNFSIDNFSAEDKALLLSSTSALAPGPVPVSAPIPPSAP